VKSTLVQLTPFLQELQSLMASQGIGTTPVWERGAVAFPPPEAGAASAPGAMASGFRNQEEWPSPIAPLVRIPFADAPTKPHLSARKTPQAPVDHWTFAGERSFLQQALAGALLEETPHNVERDAHHPLYRRFREDVREAIGSAANLVEGPRNIREQRDEIASFFKWIHLAIEDLEALGRYSAMAMLAESVGRASIDIYRQSKVAAKAHAEETGFRDLPPSIIEAHAFSTASAMVEPPWNYWTRAAKGWQLSLQEYADSPTERFRINRGLIHSAMAHNRSLFADMLEASRVWYRERRQSLELACDNLRLCLALTRVDDPIDWQEIVTLLRETMEIWTKRNDHSLPLRRLIGMAEEQAALPPPPSPFRRGSRR
jgi:hypothetical protein